MDLNEGHAMLMETPWKVSMAPAGNGALFSDLRAAGILEKLSGQGVKYVQVFIDYLLYHLYRIRSLRFGGHRRKLEDKAMKWKHVIALLEQVATTLEAWQERLRSPFSHSSMLWAFYVVHER